MKKILAFLLAALFTVTVMPFAIFAAEDTVTVSTADELFETIGKINAGILDNTTNITLTADIDFTDFEGFGPLVTYSGTFDGAGHKITGLSSTILIDNSDANCVNRDNVIGGNNFYRWSGEGIFSDDHESVKNHFCFGYCGFATLFVTLSGTVKNLTLENGTMSLQANFNKNNRMDVAYLAGYADGATLENVHAVGITVKTVGKGVNENQGFMGYAATLVARATGNTTFTNCTVDATSSVYTADSPRMHASQILGAYDGDGEITMNYCKGEAEIAVCTDKSIGLMYKSNDGVRCDGIPGELLKDNLGGALSYATELVSEGNYTFYYQTRTNKDDASLKDYRILCVATKEFAASADSLKVRIAFSNGNTEKSIEKTPETLYYNVTAEGDGYADTYTAGDGSVIFGWVITGVPADYQNTPTAAFAE
ncbi:MAG: hypothetical protein IKC63_06000 [Clostridia bacterium]|nr:hypothetical protein [Clostridia bacterium]